MEEVRSSSLRSSTSIDKHLAGDGGAGVDPGRTGVGCGELQRLCYFIGGLVAGEGSFTSASEGSFADGAPRRRHLFALHMAVDDELIILACRELLGFGALTYLKGRKAHWKDTLRLHVHSRRAIRLAVIPFFEQFLLPSRKRDQFDAWRTDFELYVEAHPKRWGQGPSPCTVAGCDRPVRARGLCRSHYYEATGN